MIESDGARTMRAFYDGFSRSDAAAMNACYATDVSFEDPVFGILAGDRARAMWTMLCSTPSGFSLTYEVLRGDENSGETRWIALYTYSATGRRVRNVVHSRFELRDAKIVRQVDTFDLWRWSAQALGPLGALLGWAPIVRRRIHAAAAERLAKFEASPAWRAALASKAQPTPP